MKVRAIKQDEGKPFDLRPVHFRWKVRGEDSAHTYTMFELNLAPGGGVDLHGHPSPETFTFSRARSHSSASPMATSAAARP
jgi:quercetin dioxygenase-like cupin family protein